MAGTSRQGHPSERRSWLGLVLLSPILWGGLLTLAFYSFIPYLPVQRELAERYFCSHPLEYATATLFFVGIAILGLKAIWLPAENAALSGRLLDGPDLSRHADPLRTTALIEGRLEGLSGRLKRTHLVGRLRDVCAYLRGRESGEGLEEHLKYRAELSFERLHESYALVRTITWAVPILGFLGTVIGITLAIANLDTEKLVTSLADVTRGLAVAFDTTALALTLSLVLVFTAFLVERAEQGVLVRVEEFGVKRLGPLFPAAGESSHPLADAETRAARQLIEQTDALIHRQTQFWHETLEAVRQRWTAALDTQKQDFDQALQQGMAATLADHAGQLSAVRGEFLEAFQRVSRELTDGLAESLQTQRSLHEESSLHHAELIGELRKQGELFLRITEQEEQLARLQDRLTENLDAVRAAETFEETLHSLNAAVHLLTARTKPKAA